MGYKSTCIIKQKYLKKKKENDTWSYNLPSQHIGWFVVYTATLYHTLLLCNTSWYNYRTPTWTQNVRIQAQSKPFIINQTDPFCVTKIVIFCNYELWKLQRLNLKETLQKLDLWILKICFSPAFGPITQVNIQTVWPSEGEGSIM